MKLDKTLLDTFELSARWFTPNSLANRQPDDVAGELEFPGMLRLNGIFGSNIIMSPNEPVIWGLTGRGLRITLGRNTAQPEGFSFPGYARCSYIPTYVFTGAWVEEPENIRVATMRISFAGLTESLGGPDPAVGFVRRPYPRSSEIAWSPNRRINPFEINSVGCTLSLVTSFDGIGLKQYAVELRQREWLEMRYLSPMQFERVVSHIFDLRNLLTLLHGQPALIEKIELEVEECDPMTRMEPGKRQTVELYLRHSSQKSDEPPHWGKMFLPLVTFQTEQIGSIFRKWYGKNEGVKIVVELLCRLMHDPSPYHRVDFVNYMQALEAFHRAVYGGQFMRDEDYQAVSDALLVVLQRTDLGLQAGHRLKLENAVRYGNDFSQRKRIQVLLKKLGAKLRRSLVADSAAFTDAMIRTRNYFIHYDESDRDQALTEIQIAAANMCLGVILNLLILKECGISEEHLSGFLPNHPIYREYDAWRRVLPAYAARRD